MQQVQRRRGLRVDLAHDVAGGFRQQHRVDRVRRHQFGDEGLVALADDVLGVTVVDREEVATQTFPEWRFAGFVGDTAHFGDDLFREPLRMCRHEQESTLGQQAPGAAGAEFRLEVQRAQHRRAGVVIGQIQRGDAVVELEFTAGVHRHAHVVVVERLVQSAGGLHRAAATDLAGVGFLKHEHVAFMPGLAHIGGEGMHGQLDLLAQIVGNRGQGGEAGPGGLGHVQQGVEVLEPDRSDDFHTLPMS